MKIGFLEYKEDGQRVWGMLCLVLCVLPLMIGGLPLLSDKRDPDFFAAVITAIVGAILGIVGIVLLRGSTSWRAGQRFCSGVMWDTVKCEGSFGHFLLKIDPRPESDSSLISWRSARPSFRAQRHAVLEITPSTKTPPSDIQNRKPELVIRLSRKHDEVEYKVGYVGFAGCEVSRSVAWMRILLDREITSLKLFNGRVGQPFAGLRELGRNLARLGPESVAVRLYVELPQPPANKQGGLAGLASNPGPGLAGGLAAAVSGVAPVLGIIAGSLATDAMTPSDGQIESAGQKQVRTMIFGAPGKPRGDSLKSVADELGWTIEAPGGFRYVGVGNAPQREA